MDVTPDPVVEDLLRDGSQRHARPLASRRERLVEGLSAATLLLASAGLLVLEPGRGFDPVLAVLLTALFAVASRVVFSVGSGSTSPAQVVVVPMLLLMPPGVVPLLVAAGYIAGLAPELLTGRSHRDRVVLCVSDAWFAIGPAAILALAGAPEPALALWPLYLLAFITQAVVDLAASGVRERLSTGLPFQLHLRVYGIFVGIDAALAPIGLLATLVAADHSAVVLLLVAPLFAVIAVFARERERRIANMLELSEAYRGTALLMGEMLEADDPYTGGEHSRGVVVLALEVGRELELDPVAQRNLEFGALLHDIGKLRVPDEILNKPGKLTPDEWEVIKRHPEDGQAMLDKVGGVLGSVGLTVRSHHERWDGGGYPDRLTGEDIPLNARIIAACDAYSAMTTNRSYRAAMPREDALAELARCAATQFDPRVVSALTAVVRRAEPVPFSLRLVA